MSKIGEYIHFSKRGYKEHGITRHGTASRYVSQRAEIIAKVKKRITNSISQIKLDQISLEMRQYLNDLSSSATSANASTKMGVENQLTTQLKLQMTNFNWGNLTLDDPLHNIEQGIPLVRTHYTTTPSGKQTLEFDTNREGLPRIASRINALENALLQRISQIMANNKGTRQGEIAALEQSLQEVKRLYEQVYGQTYDAIAASGLKDPATIVSNSKVGALRSRMNALIRELGAIPPSALWDGTFLEYALAAAAFQHSNLAPAEIQEFLKKTVQGDRHIDVDFARENFVFDQVISNNLGNVNGHVQSTRGKVDVTFTWNEIPLNITAKNIAIKNTTHHWIHTVSASPLWTMVQQLDANVMNHYLNLFTLHDNKQRAFQSNDGFATEQRSVAEDLKLYLFGTSLTGQFNNDIANVMAINDKVTGGLRLISTTELFDRLAKKMNQISVKINTGAYLHKYYYSNKWSKTGVADRLATLMAEVHKAKIYASFNMVGVV